MTADNENRGAEAAAAQAIALRPAGAADARAIHDLLAQAAAIPPGAACSLDQLHAALAAPAFRFHGLVALTSGTIVACLLYAAEFDLATGGEALRIESVVVDRAQRRRGLGRALMARLGAEAGQRGIPVRWHYALANPWATAFFAGMGVAATPAMAAWWPPDRQAAGNGAHG